MSTASHIQSLWDSSLFHKFLFLATGVFSTLAAQFAYYQGGAEKTTLLPVLANFAGISCALLIPASNHHTPAKTATHQPENQEKHTKSAFDIIWKKWPILKNPQSQYLLVGSFEVLGNIFGVLGLSYAGSGIYQVVYSSVVLFVALFSLLLLKKHLTIKQWLALFLITIGLSLSALGSKSQTRHNSEALLTTKSSKALIGIGLTLVCASFYAFSYVLVEFFLSGPNPVTKRDMQGYAGLYGLCIVLVYSIIHTIPNWEVLVTENVAAKGGDISKVFVTYLLMALSGFLHSISYFKIISGVGAVSTGVLQSLRAVSVFVFSSIAFCGTHQEQCVNNAKFMSMFVVAIGLIAYAYFAPNNKAKEVSETSSTLLQSSEKHQV